MSRRHPAAPAHFERGGAYPGRLGNTLFGGAAWVFALLVLALLAGVMVSLIIGATPAFLNFGLSFVWTEVWNLRSRTAMAPWRRFMAR